MPNRQKPHPEYPFMPLILTDKKSRRFAPKAFVLYRLTTKCLNNRTFPFHGRRVQMTETTRVIRFDSRNCPPRGSDLAPSPPFLRFRVSRDGFVWPLCGATHSGRTLSPRCLMPNCSKGPN